MFQLWFINCCFYTSDILYVTELNSQNDRILAPSSKDIRDEKKFIDRVQKPQHLMVWAGLNLPAVGPIWFLSPRGKINSEIYNELILEPEIKVRAGSYSIMKNGSSNRISAPAHASNATQSWTCRKYWVYFEGRVYFQVQILTHSTILYGGYCRQGLVQNLTRVWNLSQSALVRNGNECLIERAARFCWTV